MLCGQENEIPHLMRIGLIYVRSKEGEKRMSEFKFNCPHCNQSLEAPEEMLGDTIECPACKGFIQLPAYAPKPTPQMKKTPLRVSTPPPTPHEEQPWYYYVKGKRVGPADASQIHALATQGAIDNSTLVWREGFSEWIPLGQTTLKVASSAPPPLTGTAVSNGLVWTVAFLPILGTLLEYLIAEMTKSDPHNLWFITICLNIVICVADEKVLKNAGHDTNKFGRWAWFVPGYLFKRARALNQTPGYFIAWMICFVISLFL
jgi:hypothetical protein